MLNKGCQSMRLFTRVGEERKYLLGGIMQSLKWVLFFFMGAAYLWNVNSMW